MELSLSLGDTPKPFIFLDKSQKMVNKDLGFCMATLGPLIINGRSEDKGDAGQSHRHSKTQRIIREEEDERRGSSDHPLVHLDLFPFSPVLRNQLPSQLRFPLLTQNLISEPGSSNGPGKPVEVNRQPLTAEEAEDGAATLSSPNSTVIPFQMDFSMYGSRRSKRDLEATLTEVEAERGICSRGIDEEENGLPRKKLRLTKEQSAFLEEIFKEHHTLNPKQKLVLAKQLNLRPRQVEVWFQNRRASWVLLVYGSCMKWARFKPQTSGPEGEAEHDTGVVHMPSTMDVFLSSRTKPIDRWAQPVLHLKSWKKKVC
ncbi:unnamed protein product [Ilex paraguariensis]|uniref:Homeobox domain-containing protein n=1 Tax=Ilex paraguariensis TaxID=185542 RepID=A0ABC8TKG6_9AQUA